MCFKRLCDHMQLEQGPAFEIVLFSDAFMLGLLRDGGFGKVLWGGGSCAFWLDFFVLVFCIVNQNWMLSIVDELV